MGKRRTIVYGVAIVIAVVLIAIANSKEPAKVAVLHDSTTGGHHRGVRVAMAKFDSMMGGIDQIPRLRADVDTLKVRVTRLENRWPPKNGR